MMGKLIVMNQITINGAFEAPTPDDWLVLDEDSSEASLEQLILADALVLGRKTYEGPRRRVAAAGRRAVDGSLRRTTEPDAEVRGIAHTDRAARMERQPDQGDVETAVPALKEAHTGNLIVSGCGELAHSLTRQGSVDEFWFWVNPFIWADGPRIFDGVGPVRLELVASTPYRSGVVWLRYRPATG